ncbi:hypothetical protein SH528x_003873 [Novipirellula sp. SH528]|uniref:hypothetical protein n=1 Tax=Novipirellula sp. SH528 TaxID=3454466 RepID=UPI003F9F52A0
MTVFDCNTTSGPHHHCHSLDMLKGAVLDVVAVSLPYLFVRVHDPMRGISAMSIDIRDLQFMHVTPEYAAAIVTESEKSPQARCPF